MSWRLVRRFITNPCCAVGGIMFLLIVLLGTAFMWSKNSTPFITTSISDYGYYRGNIDDLPPTEFINSFFPQSIESCFSEVTYYYRGQGDDTYACEAYLEFCIHDLEAFNEHYLSLSQFGPPLLVNFDQQYEIWIINSDLRLSKDSPILRASNSSAGSETNYPIRFANVGLILCNLEQQRLIYSAIMVFDGGAATTDELGYFIKRFDLTPLLFEQKLSDFSKSALPCPLHR